MPARKNIKKQPLPADNNELPVIALRLVCDPDSLGFQTTDDLPDLEDVIGQPRALNALQLGSEVTGSGYNTFVLGQPGSGRTTLSKEYLERKASSMPVPDDWCYVNNFSNERKPKLIRLPAGKGAIIRQAISELITRFTSDIPRTFESDEFLRERDRLVGDLKKTQEAEFLRLQHHAEQNNFIIVRTSSGFALAPALKGKPIPPEELVNLSPKQKVKLGELEHKLGEDVQVTINRLKELEKTAFLKLQDLISRTVQFIISPLIQPIRQAFSQYPGQVRHLISGESSSDITSSVASLYLPEASSLFISGILYPAGQTTLHGASHSALCSERSSSTAFFLNSSTSAPDASISIPSCARAVHEGKYEFLTLSFTMQTMHDE